MTEISTRDFKVSESEKITEAFGEGVGFIFLTGKLTTGFYFQSNEALPELKLLDIVDTLFTGEVYRDIIDYAMNSVKTEASIRLGYINGNVEISISFSKKFKKVERRITLGKLDDELHVFYDSIKKEINRSAVCQIGSAPEAIVLFFNSFRKAELNTIGKVFQKVDIFLKMENGLAPIEKERIMELARKHCMSSKEANPRISLFKRVLGRKKEELYAFPQSH